MSSSREVAYAIRRWGRSHAQVSGEVQALHSAVERAWAAHFPVRDGYITLSSPLAGPVEGKRLQVLRGDFRAEVEIRTDEGRHPGQTEALSILLHSDAHSEHMRELEGGTERLVRRMRTVGVAAGLVLFGVMSWPIPMGLQSATLAIMFFFVLLGLLPAGGGLMGAYVGERLAAGARARLLATSSWDDRLQTDFRRWRAFARQLQTQRRMVARGSKSGPFRRESRQLAQAS